MLNMLSIESEIRVLRFLEKHFRLYAGACLSILSVSIPFNYATKNEKYTLMSIFNIHTDNVMSGISPIAYLIAYLSLFYAMMSNNILIRTRILSIGSIPLIWASLPYSPRAFRVDIVWFDDFVLTALLIVMGITTGWLSAATFRAGISSIKELYVNAIKGEHRITSLSLSSIPFVVAIPLLRQYLPILLPSYKDQPEGSDYIYSCISDGLLIIALVFATLLTVAYLRPYFDKLSYLLSILMVYLRDFSISTYITRKISGKFYQIVYIILAGCASILIPLYANMRFLDMIINDFTTGKLGVLIPLLAFPVYALVTAVFWFVTMAILRLIIEFSNAIIHIAENTTKN